MSGTDGRPAGARRRAQLLPATLPTKGRVLGIALVAVGLAAGAVVAGASGGAEPHVTLQPTALAAEAAPVGSQSSSWYCTGGSGPKKPLAAATIVVANTGSRRVTGTLDVVGSGGATGEMDFAVPPGGQVDEKPGTVVASTWLAARLDVHGGGVTANERVDGGWGSSVSPCSSETAHHWYFAQGTTVTGSSLYVSLFNPTASLAVVDLTFLTASGVISPAPDQGLVIGPGSLVTVTVGKYVQDRPEVATIVSARSGAVTAAELQLYGVDGMKGAALVLGTPAAAATWSFPQLVDVDGGRSKLEVLNPSSSTPAHVRVDVRLPSGSSAPFDQIVAPGSVWTLETSAQLRIPVGTDYSLQVTSTGGPGIVVGRIGEGTAQGPAPQWGSQAAIASSVSSSSVSSSRTLHWIVPSIATPTAGAVGSGATGSVTSKDVATSGDVVVFEDPGRTARHVAVFVMTAAGRRQVGVVHVAAHGITTFAARPAPLLVDASGPLVIEEVGSPTGGGGIVASPAVPQR